jgi:lysozyme
MIRPFLLLLLLTACARAPTAPTAAAFMAPMPQVVAPAFGESDPVAWPGRTPAAYAVHGIDLSRFQGQVDWATARAAGVNFAFVKATEGGDRLDPQFAANRDGASRAGVHVGAYHFFYFCTSATVQARWFIANVPRQPGALPPVLDLEWNHLSPTCTLRPDAAVVRAEAQTFIAILAAHYGQRPIIYTTPEFYAVNDMGQLAGEEFWLRAVTEHPGTRYPGQPWSFWQYSGTGIVPGITGRTDLNAFAGSHADWTRWLAARRL